MLGDAGEMGKRQARQETLPGEAVEAGVAGGLESFAVFGGGDTAVEGRELAGVMAGAVLVHDVYVGIARYLFGEKLHDGFGAGEALGQYEVADEESAGGHAARVKFEVADLAVHFAHGSPVDLRVIGDARQVFSGFGGVVFHVGHVDVEHAIEQLEGLDAVVSAGVVDEGDVKSLLDCDEQGVKDLGHDVRGRDEVDVVASLGLKIEHEFGDGVGGEVAADSVGAEFGVLAEHAAEVAPGKEDGARAVGSDQGRLFTEMGLGAAHARLWAGVAPAGFPREAVDVAEARADRAILQQGAGGFGAAPQFAGFV